MSEGRKITVSLDLEDAIGVGHSLLMLVRSSMIPPDTRAAYERVGKRLIDASHEAFEPATMNASAAVNRGPELNASGVLQPPVKP